MKNLFVLIPLTCLLLCFQACNNDNTLSVSSNPVDTSTFIFPFDIGNYWDYSSVSTVSDIRPDSIAYLFTGYPRHGTGKLSIIKDTVLNIDTVRKFLNVYNQDSSTYISSIYYIQNDTALLQYAYSLTSSSDIFPDNRRRLFFFFNGTKFSTLEELLVKAEYNVCSELKDTLIYETPMPASLRYPVISSINWKYRDFQTNTINKKYIGFENISIGFLNLSCIKTQIYWEPVNFFESFDYYSKHGKLKHTLYANDVIVTNELGLPLGTIDIAEYTNVTSYHVNEIMPY